MTGKRRFVAVVLAGLLLLFFVLPSFAEESTMLPAPAGKELLDALPGVWAYEAEEGDTAFLELQKDGTFTLRCTPEGGGSTCTYSGTWTFQEVPDSDDLLTLSFTTTDNPAHAADGYSVTCGYSAYTERWVENDTLVTYLLLMDLEHSGVSPFEEFYGDTGAALHRDEGPNMKVVNCKSYVSLREKRSTTSKRLAKVPLGALVLAFPEEGNEKGFLLCTYRDTFGYILSEYLQPVGGVNP